MKPAVKWVRKQQTEFFHEVMQPEMAVIANELAANGGSNSVKNIVLETRERVEALDARSKLLAEEDSKYVEQLKKLQGVVEAHVEKLQGVVEAHVEEDRSSFADIAQRQRQILSHVKALSPPAVLDKLDK